jgi:uncharacterized membrane protein YqjE
LTQSSGLLASLRILFSTLLGVAQTRLELLANELEEERLRLTRLFVYGFLSLFFFGVGVIALSMLAVAAFWDTHRLAAIAVVALLHLCIAFYCGMSARYLAAHKPKLFSATLAEIDKDCGALSSIDE